MTFYAKTFTFALLLLTLTAAHTGAATTGYWKFEDEPSGQELLSEVGTTDESASDSTLIRGTSGSGFADSTLVSGGYEGQALSFSPTQLAAFEHLANTGARSNALVSSSYTLEAFTNPDMLPSQGDVQTLLSLTDRPGDLLNFQLNVLGTASGAVLQLAYTADGDTTTTTYQSTTSLTSDTWQYVAAVLDGDSGELTLQVGEETTDFTGVLAAETDLGSVSTTSTGANPYFSLGGFYYDDSGYQRVQGYDGLLDNVRISDVALDANELLIPEPASAALLGIGAVLTSLRPRRRVARK